MTAPVRPLTMVRDVVAVAVLAVVTFQALRKWCGDRYLVPTGSMEPVLHGDPAHGDVVFVDKLARAAARRRHDLVVVQHPSEAGQQMVKRIAACGDDLPGGCWIDIRNGDVWIGESRQLMAPDVKDPLAARGQRVAWFTAPGTGARDDLVDFGPAQASGESGPWLLPALPSSLPDVRRTFAPDVRAARHRGKRVLPDGFLGTAKPVDAGFLQANGVRSATGGDVAVVDAGMQIDCARIDGEVLATIETRAEALTFHWQPRTGRVVLWRNGEDVAAQQLPPSPSPRRFEFGLLDGRVWFCVDDDPARLFLVPRRAEWGDGDPKSPGPRTLVHVGVLATGLPATGVPAIGETAALQFTALRVFHDVFAWHDRIVDLGPQTSWPRFVPPGHWFLLGDSAFDSRDSRQFGPVPASSFLGVPCLVLGPWPRCRWVTP